MIAHSQHSSPSQAPGGVRLEAGGQCHIWCAGSAFLSSVPRKRLRIEFVPILSHSFQAEEFLVGQQGRQRSLLGYRVTMTTTNTRTPCD